MNKKMIIKGVGTLMAKRICPNGEKELITLGTLQDLRIDMNTEAEDVYGGDGLFPIDDVITNKSIAISATDAKLDLNAISLMMGSGLENGANNIWALNEKYIVEEEIEDGTNDPINVIKLNKPVSDLILPYDIAPEDSVTLRLEKNNKIIPNDLFIVETTGVGQTRKTVITILSDSVAKGDVVIASYQYKVENVTVADLLRDDVPFPVHVIHHGSFQQKDGTYQSVQTELYACKARGTFSINYQRAAATASAIELQLIDPERPDGKVGSIKRFEEVKGTTACKVDELES